MNIDDLTIKQAKELSRTFGCYPNVSDKGFAGDLIGKYCIARCYSAGVHAGEVVAVDGENVILKDSRRLWSWQAKDGIALSGVAQHGLKSGSCKVDVINPTLYITGVCELIPVASSAIRESIHDYA